MRAAYVIGADGIHSKVRAACSAQDKPEFTGCVAWRGLVPMEKLPPHIAQMLGTNWLGPHGHVLHYPVRRGEIMNFISFVERDDWQVESWVDAGHHRTSSPTTSAAGTTTCTPSSATSRRRTNGR